MCGWQCGLGENAPAMLDVVDGLAKAPPRCWMRGNRRGQEFLQWLARALTFLGVRDYDLVSENGEDRLKAVPGWTRHPRERRGPGLRSFAALPRRPRCQKPSFHHHKANSRATVPPRTATTSA